MKIAKRTLFVGEKRLEELFGLPEGVEILAVRKAHNGWEFLLASAGEMFADNGEQITVYQEDGKLYRKLSLSTLKSLQTENNGVGYSPLKAVDYVKNSDDVVVSLNLKISDLEVRLKTLQSQVDGMNKLNSRSIAEEIINAVNRGSNDADL